MVEAEALFLWHFKADACWLNGSLWPSPHFFWGKETWKWACGELKPFHQLCVGSTCHFFNYLIFDQSQLDQIQNSDSYHHIKPEAYTKVQRLPKEGSWECYRLCISGRVTAQLMEVVCCFGGGSKPVQVSKLHRFWGKVLVTVISYVMVSLCVCVRWSIIQFISIDSWSSLIYLGLLELLWDT